VVRPKSIIWFEQLYLASLLLGAVATAMTWSDNMDTRQAVQVERMFGHWLVPLAVVFVYSIWVLLWYFTARARSDAARWTVTIFTGLSVVSYLWSFANGVTFASAAAVIVLVSVVLSIAAIAMLFRPDARAWFDQPK
jgi:hypothetical protein